MTGHANMDIIAYLTAPLYPYTLALFKWLAGSGWETVTIAYQFILVAISAVFLFKLSLVLFKEKALATLAAFIYICYPLTLWYNFTIVQETSFQGYFIIALYYYIKLLNQALIKDSFLSGFFFTLAMLTKSHIVMLLPIFLIILILNKQFKNGAIFLSTLLLMSLPHGLINYKQHGVFTLSSQGNAALFLLGHSDQTYPCLVSRAGSMGDFSAEGCNPDFVFNVDYADPKLGYINRLSVKERNTTRFKLALDWIKSNPRKFIHLKLIGLQRFMMPGLDYRQYKFSYWILSFIAGLLIYLPGYFVLFKNISFKANAHWVMLSLILVSAVVFIVFFPINRFRVITMEPLLCVYAAAGYFELFQKGKKTLKLNKSLPS